MRVVSTRVGDRAGRVAAVLAAAGAVALGAAAPDRAAAQPSSPDRLELVGQVGGLTADVVMAGVHAWVGVGPRIVAYDVTVPSAPRRAGESPILSGVVLDIAIADGTQAPIAFVVTGEGGIEVVDVAEPARPRRAGYVDVPDGATVVAAGDGVACAAVASDPPAVWVVDVSVPTAPRVASRIELPAEAIGLVVAERRVHMLVDEEGLRVYDIAVPAAPRLLGKAATPDRESGLGGRMHLASGYAFVADGPNGLRIFDVVDPTAPREVGRLPDVDDARAVHVANGLAYVADGARGLAVVDVASPRRPRLLGRHVADGAASSVYAVDDQVVVADERGARVVDATNPNLPRRVADIDPPGYVVAVAAEDERWFAFDGTHARLWSFVGDGVRAARAVAGVESPVTGSDGGALAAHGGFVYVAGGREGLGVVDARASDALVAVGVVTGTTAMDVDAAGRHVYVAAGGEGLAVLDAGDPGRPRRVSALPTEGFASSVYAQIGRTLLMDGRLQVIDTTDPAQPGPAVSLAMDGDLPGTVTAHLERAFVATDRLHVFDIGAPGGPAHAGGWVPTGGALVSPRVAAAPGAVYVSDAFDGSLWVLDADGDAPRERAHAVLPDGGQPLDLAVARARGAEVVLAASGDAGLTIWRHRAAGAAVGRAYLPFALKR